MNKTNIFVDTVNMETQTVFHNNGEINIYPCEFELGQEILASGWAATQKGRMITRTDGNSTFLPYAKDSGSRYDELWVNPYSVLKMSKGRLVLTVSVPLEINDPYGELSSWAMSCTRGYTSSQVERRIEQRRVEWINHRKNR